MRDIRYKFLSGLIHHLHSSDKLIEILTYHSRLRIIVYIKLLLAKAILNVRYLIRELF